MKKLRIAQVAPLWFSVPPLKYGGTERIISGLTEELTKRGHHVTLFAPKMSKTKAKLVSLINDGLISQGGLWTNDYNWNLFNHSFAFEHSSSFDIIHCHWNGMGAFFQHFLKTPVIHTMHNNISRSAQIKWKPFEYYRDTFKPVFISKSEQDLCPIRFKKSWIVYNGINLNQFDFNPNPQNHFIWIARISPEKGPLEAIEIAERAGIKLLLAGQIQPNHREYFDKEIKPRLNSQIQYVGELSQEQLSEFYGSAQGCLYPIDWEEPFGLIMAESMACGTPVIVFDRGSAREVVEDGKTGFIVKDINAAVEAIKKIKQIDRKECRKRVEENFTIKKMVDNYEKIYQDVVEEN